MNHFDTRKLIPGSGSTEKYGPKRCPDENLVTKIAEFQQSKANACRRLLWIGPVKFRSSRGAPYIAQILLPGARQISSYVIEL